MSAPRNTTHHETHPATKKRRSLKRSGHHPTTFNNRGIVVDMSKSELDGIFSGLSLGEIENPQEALGRVYGLAIDSIAETLLEGLNTLSTQVTESGDTLGNDNPLSAFLLQWIPRDPAKIDAFKEKLAAQIQAMKTRVKTSMVQGLAANSDLEQIAAVGRQTHDMVRQTLSDTAHNTSIVPGIKPHLSDARLEEMYRLIQRPVISDGVQRFKVTSLPGVYRFNMGAPKAAPPPETAHTTDTACNACHDAILDTPQTTNTTPEIVNLADTAIEHASADVSQAVSEVTGMLQNMALEMAHTMMETYHATHVMQPLSETLKTDPRLDEDLSAFLNGLEDEDAEIDEDAITNDELVGALDILLAGLHLED